MSTLQKDSNPFVYSDDNKRYHTWNYHLRHTFGKKVFKVPLDAGFTCPNRDGTKGTGGCVFCSAAGSGDFAGNRKDSLLHQFEAGKAILHQKWPDAAYIPYFQAYTNTYAPISTLRALFDPFVGMDSVVGLSIATRADALADETVAYLEELAHKTYLTVELGLQTVHDETASRINRCHSYADFLAGYQKLVSRGIRVCVHIINGLPGETDAMMLETARQVAALHPHSVKLHLLHVLKGTKLEQSYADGEFELLSRERYVSIVCEQLRLLPPETVIQRLTGDGAKDDLIGPLWSRRKREVLNEIDKQLFVTNSWQGMSYLNP